MSDPLVVFIHLGDHLPRWLMPSILDFQKNNQRNFVVVINNHQIAMHLKKYKIPNWIVPEDKIGLPSSLNNPELYYFRNGFWRESTRRFWALKEFQFYAKTSIIHFESDVKVFNNFPYSLFSKLKQPIAYPLSAPGYGVASVFYSRNYEALDKLLNFWSDEKSDKKIENIEHFVNDMTLLGLSVTKLPDLVTNLPTIHRDCQFIAEHSKSFQNTLANNFEIFGGIFDGATLGQYLFGFDARNERGIRRLFSFREYHSLRPNKMNFKFTPESQILELSCCLKESTQVFNLHIHSKDVRVFSNKFVPMINDKLESKFFKFRFEFDFWAFNESIIGTLRRIRKEIHKFLS
jgi:hypothetical protein